MSEEILFIVTQDKLDTGLRGFPVGYCTTSYVDPNKGLFYVDKPVDQLASCEPIEVIYLLYYGKEGTAEEVKKFAELVAGKSILPPEVISTIYAMPREGHPMKLLSAAILILGMFDATGDYKEDCLSLIAKMPHLVACLINHHAGWGKTPEPKPEIGYMENFAHMLKEPHFNPQMLIPVLKLFNILHYDHGGGNLSTFVGKSVASGLADIYESISAAMCALAGPRHGRANQDCLEFVVDVLNEVGEDATAEQVEKLVRHRLESGQLVFGFGHAVLRIEDPRAIVLYDFVKKHYPDHPLVKIALLLRERGAKVLAENSKITDPHPNVDAISGTALTASGFSYSEYY
ncbi:MAG: citrate (Si)-synthase, partial [Chlamydiales bacterium]|nr:citrate (Si)-synthase [Chlamydiales bacterium]